MFYLVNMIVYIIFFMAPFLISVLIFNQEHTETPFMHMAICLGISLATQLYFFLIEVVQMYELKWKYLYTYDGPSTSLNLEMFNISQCMEFVVAVSYIVIRVSYFEDVKNFLVIDH